MIYLTFGTVNTVNKISKSKTMKFFKKVCTCNFTGDSKIYICLERDRIINKNNKNLWKD